MKPKVLIVDDKVENIVLLRNTLKALDIEIIEAMSGFEALKHDIDDSFAVAIFDVQMPEMSGYELLEKFRIYERTKHLPIIFLSAFYTKEEYVIKGIESGAVDFIIKPINSSILLGKIKVFLEIFVQKQELKSLIQEKEKSNIQYAKTIAELQISQQNVTESKEIFKGITSAANESIILLTSCGKIKFWNKASEHIFKYKKNEIIGKDINNLLVHNDDYQSFKIAFEKFQSLGTNKYIGKDRELLAIDKYKKQFYINISFSSLKLKNDLNVLGIIRDISEQKESNEKIQISEQKYRTIFSQANDSIFVMDKDHFIDCNDKTLDMFGCRREDIIGKQPHIFSPEKQPDGESSLLKAEKKITAALNEKSQFFYWKHIKLDKTPFDAEISLKVIETNSNKYILAIVRDITERKKSEEKLKAAKDKAEKATKSKSAFLANMSHEIRTPMNGIIGTANLMKQTSLNKEQKELVNIIDYSANNLLTIINDILDISKIESGQIELEDIDFSLHNVVNESIKLLYLKAKQKGVELKLELAKNIPLYGKGDPVRLKQIIINLLNNAIKFTEKGCVKLSVEKIKNINEDHYIKFNIVDTGIGISKEGQKKLFKEFSQADTTITRKFGGTGLGLMISKRLSEMMDGEIGLESKLGKGSTFWFTVKIKKGKVPPYELDKTVNKEQTSIGKQLSILLAEDNLVNQQVAIFVLKQLGHKIEVAENGKLALEKFKNNKYDVILMDVQMPEMDGLEATSCIRKIEKENNVKKGIKIIAMTANAMKEDADKCFEVGMDEYISKPFKPVELASALDRI